MLMKDLIASVCLSFVHPIYKAGQCHTLLAVMFQWCDVGYRQIACVHSTRFNETAITPKRPRWHVENVAIGLSRVRPNTIATVSEAFRHAVNTAIFVLYVSDLLIRKKI